MTRGQDIPDISGTFPYGGGGLTSFRLEALDPPDPGYDFNAELLKAMNAPRVNYVKTQSTGGRGYSKGDRLRLVGGTPAVSPYDILRGIVILDPGTGYSSPQNLTVLIGGDGTTPGAGARATVTSLDEDGGIASMYVETSGITSNYDVNQPPKIRVIDSGDDIAYSGYTVVRRSVPSAGSAPRVPAAPTGLVSFAGDSRITLVWVAPAFNGGSPITGYKYRMSVEGGSVSNWITTGSVYPGVTVEDLVNGTLYKFQVLAVNAQGESEPSATSVPVAPTDVAGTPDAVENLLVYSPPISGTGYNTTAIVGWGTGAISARSSIETVGPVVPAGFTQQLETNVSVAGNVSANALLIDGNAIITGNANIQGNLTYNDITNLVTDNLVVGLGNSQSGTEVTGAGIVVGNTNQATFLYRFSSNSWESNINLSVAGNVRASNTIFATAFTGDGSNVANVVALTVSEGAQANITSVGELTSLSVVGNIVSGNIRTDGIISAQGSIATSGNVSAGLFIGNGGLLSNIQANVSRLINGSYTVNLSSTGTVIYPSVDDQQQALTGTTTTVYGDPYTIEVSPGILDTIWTATSANVIGFKMSVRAQVGNSSAITNVEIADITCSTDGTLANTSYVISNRVKSNLSAPDMTYDVNYNGTQELIVQTINTNSQIAYFTHSVTEFNKT
jgi:hypothetical protein